ELTDDRHVFHGRLLDGAGAGLGDEFAISDPGAFVGTDANAVAAMATGSAFVWQERFQFWGRLYDEHGIPRGSRFAISDPDGATGFDADADGMPDGGFVTVWQNGPNLTLARVYRADGQARGP